MEELLISGVYKITNPKGRIYIGQAEDLISREIDYQRVYPVKNQVRIYNSIMKYGWEAHIFEVWERCPIENLDRIERYWQEYFDVLSPIGMNCKYTPTNEKRQVISEETKQKISNTLKGRHPSKESIEKSRLSRIGKPMPEETKRKISLANRGRKNSLESIKKGADAIRGIPLSQEHKDNIRKALVGRKLSKKHIKSIAERSRKIIIQYDLEGNCIKEWDSISEAASILNICISSISLCCTNKYKTAGGFKWKYKLKNKMENKKTINIRKTECATLKGLGYNTQAIAKHYQITNEEAVEALKQLGLYKTKATSGKTKDYVVTTEDDTNNGVPTFVTATELETVTNN